MFYFTKTNCRNKVKVLTLVKEFGTLAIPGGRDGKESWKLMTANVNEAGLEKLH